MMRFTMVLLVLGLLVTLRFDDHPAHANEPEFRSENFVVNTYRGGPAAENVATLCESLRVELTRVWCNKTIATWNPPCEIRIHATLASYVHSVGPGGAQTLGSSLIQVNAGRTLSRRIDLLVDPTGELPALPHELTHVVLSDRFDGQQPPHWLDEGAAMMADTDHKRSLHERDCREALRQGSAMPLSVLFSLEQFTSAEQMAAFYGQSASLTKFLCTKGGIQDVTRFGVDAMRVGYQQALKDNYKIASVMELEHQWKQSIYNGDPELRNPVELSVSFRP
tara:strand:- start:6050 stop:6886 length:837 start_codon:yes stop_codon:yes gene_type:complete